MSNIHLKPPRFRWIWYVWGLLVAAAVWLGWSAGKEDW